MRSIVICSQNKRWQVPARRKGLPLRLGKLLGRNETVLGWDRDSWARLSKRYNFGLAETFSPELAIRVGCMEEQGRVHLTTLRQYHFPSSRSCGNSTFLLRLPSPQIIFHLVMTIIHSPKWVPK